MTVKTEWSTAANATVKKDEVFIASEKLRNIHCPVTAGNKLGVGEPAVITVKFTC